MEKHNREELQAVELPGNVEGAVDRTRDGPEMERNESGKECEELQVVDLPENVKGADERTCDGPKWEEMRMERSGRT